MTDPFCKLRFRGLNNLERIEFNDCYFTTGATDFSQMFQDCYHVVSLDLSGFDTSAVTNMSYMFDDCHELKEINLSSFKTGNVINMTKMFSGISCEKLDLSGFDFSKVTRMDEMFEGSSKLTDIGCTITPIEGTSWVGMYKDSGL